jgi:hypothetical protein
VSVLRGRRWCPRVAAVGGSWPPRAQPLAQVALDGCWRHCCVVCLLTRRGGKHSLDAHECGCTLCVGLMWSGKASFASSSRAGVGGSVCGCLCGWLGACVRTSALNCRVLWRGALLGARVDTGGLGALATVTSSTRSKPCCVRAYSRDTDLCVTLTSVVCVASGGRLSCVRAWSDGACVSV